MTYQLFLMFFRLKHCWMMYSYIIHYINLSYSEKPGQYHNSHLRQIRSSWIACQRTSEIIYLLHNTCYCNLSSQCILLFILILIATTDFILISFIALLPTPFFLQYYRPTYLCHFWGVKEHFKQSTNLYLLAF